jgi:hypothetical protein
MQRIAILSAALILIALALACGSPDASNSSNSRSSSGDSPTEAYKRLFAAVKSKDTNAIKNEMSKLSVSFVESAASMQNKPIDQVYSNGLTGTTFSDNLPEIRDERIKDNMAAVEVYNSREKKWEDLPFVLEDGKWKLGIGDAFKGSYQSPGKGRDQKEKDAANALGGNRIVENPAANTNTMGMTANSLPGSPKANTK